MDSYNVLFLCTGNSARSVMAEALLNYWGKGRFQAFSAGSFPKGEVHPLAIATLQRSKLPTDQLRSKSWNEFSSPDAPPMQFVFTVCDNAAAEVCPVWPGQPMTAHWGVEDPAAAVGIRPAVLLRHIDLRRANAAPRAGDIRERQGHDRHRLPVRDPRHRSARDGRRARARLGARRGRARGQCAAVSRPRMRLSSV